MSEQVKPIQKILFGSPGTGKSYQVREIAKNELNIPFDEDTKTLRNTIKTVFHPEYTYADFMGKLLPLTQNGFIIYKFYPGHFLRILGMAYKALIDGSNESFLLVIDELNRGNAAAIFGTVFQLLDRESDGWSSYEVDISDMELFGLLEAMRLNPIIQQDGSIDINDGGAKRSYKNYLENKASQLNGNNPNGSRACNLLKQRRINIPNNLSIIATINTSDESIYYLDSAFKRRWDWEYVNSPSGKFKTEDIHPDLRLVYLTVNDKPIGKWSYYIIGINEFIKSNYQSIRRIEDKQIGWWFIKPEDGKVEIQQVRDKLMCYLWDSVFTRAKYRTKSCKSRQEGVLYKDNHIANKTPIKEINLFREMLQHHLQWNAARLAFVSTFLIALMRVKTVNLAEIATGFSGEAKVASHYKRIQRFFRDFEVDYESIALMIVKVMKIPEPWVISIDRTDWQFGKTVFNVLTLGVVHHGVAFPLVWIMLDKKGNSNTRERCELWNRFLEIFADRKIDFLTADREFVGEDWFDYLLCDPCTHFRIRIRKNTLLDDGQKQLRADVCFQDLQIGQSKVLSHPRKVWNHSLYIAAMRLDDGDLLIVATAHDPDTAISDYAKRWAIETLFGCFKTRGFCLESTHLQDSERLSKLIALLTMALCWAFSSGLWLAQLNPLKPKKHGRLPKSIFRLGFDFLRHIIFDLHLNSRAFFNSINFLSCT